MLITIAAQLILTTLAVVEVCLLDVGLTSALPCNGTHVTRSIACSLCDSGAYRNDACTRSVVQDNFKIILKTDTI